MVVYNKWKRGPFTRLKACCRITGVIPGSQLIIVIWFFFLNQSGFARFKEGNERFGSIGEVNLQKLTTVTAPAVSSDMHKTKSNIFQCKWVEGFIRVRGKIIYVASSPQRTGQIQLMLWREDHTQRLHMDSSGCRIFTWRYSSAEAHFSQVIKKQLKLQEWPWVWHLIFFYFSVFLFLVCIQINFLILNIVSPFWKCHYHLVGWAQSHFTSSNSINVKRLFQWFPIQKSITCSPVAC